MKLLLIASWNILLIMFVFWLMLHFELLDLKKFNQINIYDHKINLLFSTLTLTFINGLMGIRWFILAKMLSIRVHVIEVLNVTFKAGIFVYFLPAQLSIDAMRIAKFRKRGSNNGIYDVISATIFDKVIALSSQVFLLASIWAVIMNGIMIFSVTFALFLVLFALLIICFNNKKLIEKIKFFNLNVKTEHILRCCYVLVFSSILNISVGFVVYILSKVYSFDISFITILFSTLASNLASIIPFTPNGIGISELIFDTSTRYLVASAGGGLAVIYIAFRVLNFISYLLGVVFIYIYLIIVERVLT